MKIVDRVRDLSIRSKLMGSFSVLVVIPLITILLLSNQVITRFMLGNIASLNENSVSDAAKVLNRTLDDMAFTLLNTANQGAVRDILRQDAAAEAPSEGTHRYENQKVFDDIFDKIPISLMTYNARISILGAGGSDYGNWEEFSRDTEKMKQSGWYRDLMASRDTGIRWLGVTGGGTGYGIEAAIPVKTANSSPVRVGAVHVRIDERDIFKALNSASANNEIYLIQRDGKILSCKNTKEIDTDMNQRLDVATLHRQQGQWYITRDSSGEELVVSSMQIDKGDWTLVFLIPYRRMIAPMLRIRNILLLINLASMLSFILVALVISRIISRPILQLEAGMKQVEDGNLETRVAVRSRDEIGRLSHSFNNMLERVRELLVLTKAQERQKRDAEFEARQAQINPHFLFNTLSSIRWAAAASKDHKVENMVHALSVLLRSSIDQGQEMADIRSEVDVLRHYLNLMSMKQGTVYQLQTDIPGEIMKYRIPHLLLQPVVENAVMHGFEDHHGPCCIRIQATVEGQRLILTLTDNGVGLRGKTLAQIMDRVTDGRERSQYHQSIGLRNIYERIVLHYGPDYGLDVRDHPEGGAAVSLCLPYLKE